MVLRLQGGQDLQPLFPPARDKTGCHGGLNAPQPTGVGYNDAFDVFNDIAADGDFHSVRQLRPAASGGVPGCSGAISQGNGFGAAHGGNQLLP